MVLVFWKPPRSAGEVSGTAPNLQLVGIERVDVMRGKTQIVSVRVDVCKGRSLVDSEGKRKSVVGLQRTHSLLDLLVSAKSGTISLFGLIKVKPKQNQS